MVSGPAFERIVDEIYRAATHDLPWGDVLALLTDATDGSFAYFQEHDVVTGEMVRLLHDQAPLESVGSYVDYWSKRDPRLAFSMRYPTHALYTDYAIMGDEAAIERNEFYNEYMTSIDVRYMVASSIPMPDGPDGSTRSAIVGVNRRRSVGHAGQAECDLMLALRPHFVRAFAIESRLRAAETRTGALGDVLNTLSYGVVVVDGAATIRWANETAQEMLAARAAITQDHAGVLDAAQQAERQRLHELIASAYRAVAGENTTPGGSMLLGRGTANAIAVLVAPLPRRSDIITPLGGAGGVVVFLHNPATRQTAIPEALAALYGLTPAEVRLAVILAGGLTLKQAADELNTTHETVRTYIKRVYAKTDTNTQAQLVRAVLNGPAMLVARK